MSCLLDALIRRAKRNPYIHLDGYMERYWLLKPGKWFPVSIRLHHILRSDNDRHLHDHPWPSCSIILSGGYIEVVPQDQRQHPVLDLDKTFLLFKRRRVGSVIFRRAATRHRLELRQPCWSVFIMIGKRRQWGFHTPSGWVYWRDYLGVAEGVRDD